MKYYEDLKFTEISEILGVTVGALKALPYSKEKIIDELKLTKPLTKTLSIY